MPKKTKDNTIDLLYVNNKNKSKKQKNPKNKNVPKKTEKQKDIIDLDNEIIIGLTPKTTTAKPKKTTSSTKTKKAKTSKQTNNKKKAKNKNEISPKHKRRLKILKWTSIAILVIGVIVLFMLSPIFDVKQITVEGIQKLTAEEVINLSQIKIDENTFKVRGVDVIERIKTNTYVDTVDIERELPSTIKITVKERKPHYMIEIANGNVYIDSKGYILEISTEKIQVPILKGYETSTENIIDYQNTRKLSDEDCKKLEIVNQVYEAAENNAVLEYITSIDMTDIDNITLNLDKEKKVAYLGDASNANYRILYLKAMIEEESGKVGEAFINGDLKKPKPYFREAVK